MKKKLLTAALIVMMICCAGAFGIRTTSSAADGDREVITVYTAAQLYRYSGKDVDCDFELAADIDMCGVPGTYENYYNDGTNSHFQGFKSFSGTFDGNGFAIKNMVLQALPSSSTESPSFFGVMAEGSAVKDVEFIDYTINPYRAPEDMSGHIGRAAFISSRLSGTIDNVILKYDSQGVNFTEGADSAPLGILTYECTETAAVTNVVMKGVLATSNACAVTTKGSGFTARNILQFGLDKNGLTGILPAGGAGSTANFIQVDASGLNNAFYGFRNGTIEGCVADPDAFPEEAWDYAYFIDAGAENVNFPRLINMPSEITFTEISSPDQIAALSRQDVSGNFILTQDIDMTGVSSFYGFKSFGGIFLGNGYTIKNLTVYMDDANKEVSFFGDVNKNSVIENLTLQMSIDTSTVTDPSNSSYSFLAQTVRDSYIGDVIITGVLPQATLSNPYRWFSPLAWVANKGTVMRNIVVDATIPNNNFFWPMGHQTAVDGEVAGEGESINGDYYNITSCTSCPKAYPFLTTGRAELFTTERLTEIRMRPTDTHTG